MAEGNQSDHDAAAVDQSALGASTGASDRATVENLIRQMLERLPFGCPACATELFTSVLAAAADKAEDDAASSPGEGRRVDVVRLFVGHMFEEVRVQLEQPVTGGPRTWRRVPTWTVLLDRAKQAGKRRARVRVLVPGHGNMCQRARPRRNPRVPPPAKHE